MLVLFTLASLVSGISPVVDNFMHIVGFLTGFLLALVLQAYLLTFYITTYITIYASPASSSPSCCRHG